ncbi:MAG: hypothetical protein H6Q56_10 [Deltaproteobacteria bacterium]|nr:hypothetical protein [Deltaproteobacteria bacterium]
MFKKLKTYLIVAAGLMAFAMAGCSGDDGDSSVTNPTADKLYPTGTIQGKLIDACTQMPIRNAAIDIGVQKVYTNEDGHYVFYKVPATQQADGKFHGEYSVTIDMRKATDPNGNQLAGKYPDFAYDEVKCTFTTLAGSGNTESGDVTVSGNNPAVPVLGVAEGSQDFTVGALNAIIRGKVSGTTASPAAGKYVALYATRLHYGDDAGETNSATGADDNLVKTTIVAADGTYTFTGVEAQRYFKIKVTDTDPTSATAAEPSKKLYTSACTECGGVVKWADEVEWSAPAEQCISVNRIHHADYQVAAAGTDTFNVVFTFVYPVAASNNLNGIPVTTGAADVAAANLALTSAGNPHSLYAKVKAQFEGYKGTTVPHSLSWNSTFTQLTVSIPNIAAAAIYKVDITDALEDGLFGSIDCGDGYVEFYTFGAGTAVQPKLTAINQPYDYDSDIQLSWTPTANAKAYNIYCQAVENWGTTTEAMAWTKLNKFPWLLSVYNFSHDGFETEWGSPFLHLQTDNFIENWKIALSYDCKVRGVNADGTENSVDTTDNVVTGLKDTVKPQIAFGTNLITAVADKQDYFAVTFNEPMQKDVAENPASYTFDPTGWTVIPVIKSIIYDVPNRTAYITMTAPFDPANVVKAEITVGANQIPETGLTGDSVAVTPSATAVCVSAGVNTTLDTVPAGDDVISTTNILTGPDGLCNTTIAGDDVQAIPVGGAAAGSVIVRDGADLSFQTAGGDDVVVRYNMITIAVPDVAGNALDATSDQIYTNRNSPRTH